MKTIKSSWTILAVILVILSATLFGCGGGSGGYGSSSGGNTQAAATPTFTPPAGTYATDQSVSIQSSTAGAIIYYTTDGSVPTISSTVFSNPIPVVGNGTTVTIKAIAYQYGLTNSAVASATYSISSTAGQTVAAPTLTPSAGTYSADQLITIQSSTAGATIYYTTDGSVPTTSSNVYVNPISVAGNGTNVTIKAVAVKSGMTVSTIASATYIIDTSILFSYLPSSAGGLIQSSWIPPAGSDADMYAYDDFTLGSTQPINEVDWRGGYAQGAPYGHASDFTVTFFDSTTDGSQPLVTRPDTPEIYLAKYTAGGNAGETLVGIFGGIAMYDYKFVLPTSFQAVGGKKYWLRIEASQNTLPDWGIAVGTGGDGKYFRFSTASGGQFLMISGGDTAFTLRK